MQHTSNMRRCCKCRVEKPVDKFCRNKAIKDGIHIKCKQCCNDEAKARKEARRNGLISTVQRNSKPCSKCQQVRPISDFYVDNNSSDGRTSCCKSCQAPRIRNRHLAKHYGLSIRDFQYLLARQGNRCAICHTDTPGGSNNQFHVDHCHKTGVLHGLLCTKCNVALGHMDDDPARLEAAACYLRKSAMAVIEKESHPEFHVGVNSDIDQVAEQLTTTSVVARKYVYIKANSGNSGDVYVGRQGVSASNGYPLDAGEEVIIPVDDPSKIWVIGSADNQGVKWVAV